MVANFINIDNSKFSLNGIELYKSFIAIDLGNGMIKVVSSYDSKFVLLQNTPILDISIGNVTYSTASDLIKDLNDVIYSKITLTPSEVQEIKDAVQDVNNTVQSISAGEGGTLYDTLAEAQGLTTKPSNGTIFQVSKITDANNAGYYTFQSAEPNGTRFEKKFPVIFNDFQVARVGLNMSEILNDFNLSVFNARLGIPSEDRKKDLIITYKTLGYWRKEIYRGSTFTNTEILKRDNWERLDINTGIFHKKATLQGSVTSVQLDDCIKVKKITTSSDFNPFKNIGENKNFYIKNFGELGNDYKVTINGENNEGIDYKIGDFIIPKVDVTDNTSVTGFIENNEIRFDFIADFSVVGTGNGIQTMSYADTGFSKEIISYYSNFENKEEKEILNVDTTSNTYWDLVSIKNFFNSTKYRLSFTLNESDINPSYSKHFGFNFKGIIDSNFAPVNQSIKFDFLRERIEISNSTTGYTSSLIRSKEMKFDLLCNDGIVWFFYNNQFIHKFVLKSDTYTLGYLFMQKGAFVLTNPTVKRIKGELSNNDLTAKKGTFEKIDVEQSISAEGFYNKKGYKTKLRDLSDVTAVGGKLLSGVAGTSNAVYELPFMISDVSRFRFKFKPSFDIHSGIEEYFQIVGLNAIFSSYNVAYDKAFNVYVKKQAPSVGTTSVNGLTIRSSKPQYNGGARVEFGTKGHNNDYTEYSGNGHGTREWTDGDVFSVRFTGDANLTANQDLIISVTATDLIIKHEGGAVIDSFILSNYATIYDLYIALKNSTSLVNYEFEFQSLDGTPDDLLRFEKIYLCQNPPNGNVSTGGGFAGGQFWTAFPIYLQRKDSQWHEVEIIINKNKPEAFRVYIDGVYSQLVYKDRVPNTSTLEGTIIVGGDSSGVSSNVDIKDFEFEIGNTEPYTPKILTFLAHHVDDVPEIDGADPYYTTLRKMLEVADYAISKGWKPITLKELENFYTRKKEIPVKSFLFTFDDSIDEILATRIRGEFERRGIKPSIPMLFGRTYTEDIRKLYQAAYGNDWGITLHDQTHTKYMGCYTFDEIRPHIDLGMKSMVDLFGIFNNVYVNNFGWGTPMSSRETVRQGNPIVFGEFGERTYHMTGWGNSPSYLYRYVVQSIGSINEVKAIIDFV